ncbi:MAG: sulfatase [Anaerolineae bacterium]|nr:sulfatase [Anaerolineae bacterium]
MTLPNIVLMTCHDLGQHLSCYGHETVVSPNLDRLAAEGVRVAASFCTAPQCSPSRAALHTGRHAHSVGVLGLVHSPFNWQLQPASAHFARQVKDGLSYHTALFGAQHVTRPALQSALGFAHLSPEAAAPALGEALRAYLSALDNQQPFYVEVDFTEPHRPYDWGGAAPEDSRGVQLPPYIPGVADSVSEFAALQGAIRQLDTGVGIVLAALDEYGLRDNTFVVFVTDHGLAMPRAKCTLYDPGIETALLLRWPAGGLTGDRVLTPLISHVDLVPTLLEALGQPVPAGAFHGHSFWPLLQDAPYEANDAIFAEKTYHTAYEPMRAVRTATHKLIVNFETGSSYDVPDDVRNGLIYPHVIARATGHRRPVELYDLERDPLEQDNLAGRPEVAELEAPLLQRLHRWMEDTSDPLLDGPPPSPFYAATMALLAGRE